MTLITTIRYQVEQLVGDKWLPTWTQIVDGITTPLLFDTKEEALGELSTLAKEHQKDGIELDHASYRVEPVTVYDPAPLYPVGFQFQMRPGPGFNLQNMILTYRFWNGEGWRYHLALDLGPEGSPVPTEYQRVPLGTLNGRQYVDFTTIDEFQVAGQRVPLPSELPMFVVQRGYGVMAEYWNPQLGWVNRAFARGYTESELHAQGCPTEGRIERIM